MDNFSKAHRYLIQTAQNSLLEREYSEPYIQWNHIDGPCLHLSDGQLHWLTWRDRFRLWAGLVDINYLNSYYMDNPRW